MTCSVGRYSSADKAGGGGPRADAALTRAAELTSENRARMGDLLGSFGNGAVAVKIFTV